MHSSKPCIHISSSMNSLEINVECFIIQVTTETYKILRLFGYVFEQRGLVNVKGKGQLMTYYLINKGPEPSEEETKLLLAELEESQTHNPENVQ